MSRINRPFFFDTARLTLFGGALKQAQVDGLTAFLDYWETNHATKDDRWLAYILATAHHEVDRTFRPIKEYGGDRYFFQMYDIDGFRLRVARTLGNYAKGDGVLFHGRGFVQLTGRANYAFWQTELKTDLTSSRAMADKVLQLNVAIPIIFEGSIRGTFTGKKLEDYISGVRQDWKGARRIINGQDKANLIASYATDYYRAISYTTGD